MNTTTTIQMFEKVRPIEALLKSKDVITRFAEALGMEKVQPYIASVLMLVMQNPDLMQCEPASVLFAALDAAQLRLSVSPQLGHAYIVPFKELGTPKATLIVGYKGMKFMAIRTGLYEALDCIPIFQGERVRVDRMGGWAEPTDDKATDLTKIIGRLAYFKMNDGYKKALYMTLEEIHAHARQFAKSYNNPKSAWRKPWMVGAMEAKTPFRLLMEHDGYMDPFELAMAGREDRAEVVEGEARKVVSNPDLTPGPFQGSEAVEVVSPPDPTSGKGSQTAETLRERIVRRAGELAMKGKTEADSSQRALLTLRLNECFAGDPMADKKRHDATKALTGYATIDRMPGTTVLAMIWCICRVSEGKFLLDEKAAEEVRSLVG